MRDFEELRTHFFTQLKDVMSKITTEMSTMEGKMLSILETQRKENEATIAKLMQEYRLPRSSSLEESNFGVGGSASPPSSSTTRQPLAVSDALQRVFVQLHNLEVDILDVKTQHRISMAEADGFKARLAVVDDTLKKVTSQFYDENVEASPISPVSVRDLPESEAQPGPSANEEVEKLRHAFMVSTQTLANGLIEASNAISKSEATLRRKFDGKLSELAQQVQGVDHKLEAFGKQLAGFFGGVSPLDDESQPFSEPHSVGSLRIAGDSAFSSRSSSSHENRQRFNSADLLANLTMQVKNTGSPAVGSSAPSTRDVGELYEEVAEACAPRAFSDDNATEDDIRAGLQAIDSELQRLRAAFGPTG